MRAAVASLACAVLTSACSASPEPAADRTVNPSPTRAEQATSSNSSPFAKRNVTLSCSESIGVPPGESVDDVPFRGLTAMDNEPPLAEDVLGFDLPSDMPAYFRKNPLVVRKNAADFTVSVSVSDSSQALVWVPAAVWTTQGTRQPELTRWAASSLTLHSCPDRAAMFLGGILADLNTCLQLTTRQAGHAERTVRQRLDGSPCIK